MPEDGILYKYFRITTLNLECLKRGEIFLSHPSRFNDPFDSIVNAKANDEEILKDISNYLISSDPNGHHICDFESLRIQWGEWKNNDPNQASTPHFSDSLKYLANDFPWCYEKYKRHVLGSTSTKFEALRAYLRTTESLGVCSFSKNCDSESMWAYYADSHKGICVEFLYEPGKLKSPANLEWVSYEDGDHYLDLSKAPDMAIVAKAGFKSKCWKHEDEWRLVHPSKTNSCIPFPGTIKSIILGVYTPKHEEDLIKRIFDSNIIPLYRMRLDYGNKKIVRSRISDGLDL